MPMRFKMTRIYNLSKRLLMLSFIESKRLFAFSLAAIMNLYLYKSSIRLLIATSSPFTSRMSSSLKRKAKGSALYTISSFFSVSGAMAKSYFEGLPDIKGRCKMQDAGYRMQDAPPHRPPLVSGELKGGIIHHAGFTLVEVLIALVVLLLVSLALLQTAMLSIENNMINVLRDEAVGIAEMRMNEVRNTSFGSLVEGTSTDSVTRNLRNITSFSYNVTRTISDLNVDNKQVNITVGWTWKGQDYTHTITSIVRKQ